MTTCERQFRRVRPGTFWPATWTHAQGTLRMHGDRRGWVGRVLLSAGAVVVLVGHASVMARAMLIGWAWGADGGHVLLIAGRRDSPRRWTVDVVLIMGAAALTVWTYPQAPLWAQVSLIAMWVAFALLGPWLRRRLPRAEWVVGGISSRGRAAGALLRAARLFDELGEPGERVATYAASDRHMDVYKRFGFVSTERDPHAMIAAIPRAIQTSDKSGGRPAPCSRSHHARGVAG